MLDNVWWKFVSDRQMTRGCSREFEGDKGPLDRGRTEPIQGIPYTQLTTPPEAKRIHPTAGWYVSQGVSPEIEME